MIYKLFALGFVALAVMWGFSNKYTEATYYLLLGIFWLLYGSYPK